MYLLPVHPLLRRTLAQALTQRLALSSYSSRFGHTHNPLAAAARHLSSSARTRERYIQIAHGHLIPHRITPIRTAAPPPRRAAAHGSQEEEESANTTWCNNMSRDGEERDTARPPALGQEVDATTTAATGIAPDLPIPNAGVEHGGLKVNPALARIRGGSSAAGGGGGSGSGSGSGGEVIPSPSVIRAVRRGGAPDRAASTPSALGGAGGEASSSDSGLESDADELLENVKDMQEATASMHLPQDELPAGAPVQAKKRFAILYCESQAEWSEELPRLWLKLLRQPGEEWVLYRVAEKGELPTVEDDFDGVIIPGSSHSSYEDLPWVRMSARAVRRGCCRAVRTPSAVSALTTPCRSTSSRIMCVRATFRS
ncbi:MAG: hypothetical protein EOO41_01905 [Methanobacteriota archaeon]|nr:MAG: hypothetical protein EOO41_01905 [Euryarchaeota archaeon]